MKIDYVNLVAAAGKANDSLSALINTLGKNRERDKMNNSRNLERPVDPLSFKLAKKMTPTIEAHYGFEFGPNYSDYKNIILAELQAYYEQVEKYSVGSGPQTFGPAVMNDGFAFAFLNVNGREALHFTHLFNSTLSNIQASNIPAAFLASLNELSETPYHYSCISHGAFLAHRHGVIIGKLVIGEGTRELSTLNVEVIGDRQFVADINATINEISIVDSRDPIVKRMSLLSNGSISTTEKSVKSRRAIQDPDAFWATVGDDPREVARKFAESSSNVLILYGAPGLGKSQFLAGMVRWVNENTSSRVYICDDQSVFKSTDFTPFVHSLNDGSWLITEDAHEMIESREAGNSLMASILNASEGLTSGNVKFLVSTNIMSLRGVDTALYRPGRTYRALQFKMLNQEQGNAARLAIGFEPVDFGGKDKLTLAEALNWESYLELSQQTLTAGF